jgi:hypothetical protein
MATSPRPMRGRRAEPSDAGVGHRSWPAARLQPCDQGADVEADLGGEFGEDLGPVGLLGLGRGRFADPAQEAVGELASSP